MDERLLKQWEVTATLLNEAAAEVSHDPTHDAYREYIEHNELGRALDILEDVGHECAVSRDYWWNLKKAAEVMGLRHRLPELQKQLRLAGEVTRSGTWAFRETLGYQNVLTISFAESSHAPLSIELTFEQREDYMAGGRVALESLARRVGCKPWKFQDQQVELSAQLAADVVPEWSGTWKA